MVQHIITSCLRLTRECYHVISDVGYQLVGGGGSVTIQCSDVVVSYIVFGCGLLRIQGRKIGLVYSRSAWQEITTNSQNPQLYLYMDTINLMDNISTNFKSTTVLFDG